MSDPLRSDPTRVPETVSEAERDAKIEQLLLAGLDHYFAARYEQSVNVWTRALFFDRSHARARAYIERARSALAEQQRESEELLQNGLAAFERGDAGAARRLLQLAIEQGAPPGEAPVALGRLDRLEPATDQAEQQGLEQARSVFDGQAKRLSPARFPPPAHSAAPLSAASLSSATTLSSTMELRGLQPPAAELPAATERSPKSRAPLALAALFLVVALAGLIAARAGGAQWAAYLNSEPATPPAQTAPSFTVAQPELPRRGEMALDLARTLVAGGRLRDALVALDRVRSTDPERADADRLLADVQKQLIALAGVPASGGDRETAGPARP